jgi:hypothetical protein
MATKSAHWQAAFRRRMREAGLKSVIIWMPKEGADRLARYPEKERGEVVTRALVLLESQGEFTGNDATLTDKLTGELREEEKGKAEEGTLTLRGLFTRLVRVEAILSTITSNSTGVLTGNEPPGPQAILTGESTSKLTGEAASEATSITGESTDKSTGEVVVTITEIPSPPVAEHPAKLPPQACSRPISPGIETVCPGGELEGDCKAVEYGGYPHTFRYREMARVDRQAYDRKHGRVEAE